MTNSYPSGSPGVPDSSMPTGAPGIVPRRSSYASVVSGQASAISQQYHQPARSGAFSHLLNHHPDFSYDPNYPHSSVHSRFDLRAYDMDLNTNGGSHGRSGSWGRGGQLPSFSSAFGTSMNGHGHGGIGGAHIDHFFIPSYLKGSKYVQKLEEAHKAKYSTQKDGHSAQSSQPGSLSTSTSSINLHTKMAPSHRGMTYDLIEKAPPLEDEALAPLPSKWSSQDKYGGLEVLADGQEVKFTGPKADRDREHEACAIRADHPMPPQCGIYYFEVTIISRKREESSIGIGFSTKTVPLSRLPGWEPESWAYHGDDGKSYCCQLSGKIYGPPFTAGDIIGCGVNFRTGSAFFTKNGDPLGTAFREIKGKLYPSVGMKKAGEHIRVNFGQSPFIFDIDGMMSASNNFDLSRILPSLDFAQNAPAAAPGSATVLGPDPSISSASTNDIFARDDSAVNSSAAAILEGPTPAEDPGARTGLALLAEHALLRQAELMAYRETSPRPNPSPDPSIAEQTMESVVSPLNNVPHSETEALLPTATTQFASTAAPRIVTDRNLLDAARWVARPGDSIWSFQPILIRRLSSPGSLAELLLDPPDPVEFTSDFNRAVLPGPADNIQSAAAERRHIHLPFSGRISHQSPRLQQITHDTSADDIQRERKQTLQDIDATSTAKLAPPLSETELIQSLVLQFLTHDGYIETARAFAEEVHTEKKALRLDPDAVIDGFDVKEDEDAGFRQRIRAAILDGDVEKALKYTNAYYPNVLKDNEHVYFRLRCRRFIEMIRQGAEMQSSSPTNGTKKSNGHSGDWYDDIINQDMDLDDHQSQRNDWDRMDTEEASENHIEYDRLLQATLAYGQDLQAEFKDDPRREVSKALEDAFALMAYQDPLNAKEVAHLLDPSGRVAVAEELNSAILLSLGKSSSAALEQLIQQSTVLLEDLREGGGPGAFVNIDDFVKPKTRH